MKQIRIAALAAAIVASAFGAAARADSISDVENARAKERAGYGLSRQDREKLRRYGGNDDYGWRDGYRDEGYYDDRYGRGVSIYVGPRGGYGRYGY
ncbi:MAG: hypothetical protein ACT4OU_10765 [Hyphomicrobium sp.]